MLHFADLQAQQAELDTANNAATVLGRQGNAFRFAVLARMVCQFFIYVLKGQVDAKKLLCGIPFEQLELPFILWQTTDTKPLLQSMKQRLQATYLPFGGLLPLPPEGAGVLLGAPTGPFAGGVFPLLPPEGVGVLPGPGAGALVAIVTS
ncbi:MAG: hypothetical protein A3J97_15240 [Spirochaetes bacterium RIFOXYC1_FULL_54_7]|nr:MAG: hypothetical protein A3J97_15240 [Spirochaetes bacterium RIFOXYC1_FULL_54_7]